MCLVSFFAIKYGTVWIMDESQQDKSMMIDAWYICTTSVSFVEYIRYMITYYNYMQDKYSWWHSIPTVW